ncbi:hypothetical protein FB474_1398 [Oryzihumus leptocrescens]|uniref:DUF7144 domain-containing protein n=2 Tax=Oryzihumus leptocrescens TaxID=297536 RepID=A0A542ZI31_9MICO|nr:hypothetical protein FB474_1398 [Oryzihumus leptocrescens]
MSDMSNFSSARSMEAGMPQHASSAGPISEHPQTAWVGWAYFAGIMMMMVGAFQVIEALTALFNQNYLLVSSKGLLVHVNIAAWGWVHLIIGVVLIAAGFAVLAGKMWARIIGMALAGLSAIVNLAYIAAYPLWSITIIALDVLVIYALAVHGGELKES